MVMGESWNKRQRRYMKKGQKEAVRWNTSFKPTWRLYAVMIITVAVVLWLRLH